MKRIFTHLFVAVLLMVGMPSWAQNATKTFTVSPSDGSYNQTGWCSNWTSESSEYPVTKIDVAGGINNMNASTTSGGFEMAVGTNGNSNYTWNFSVPGYKIESYSFKFKSKNNNQNINVVAGSQTITSSYSEEKTLEVNNVNAQVASFQLTGSNVAIIVTELTFTVTPILEVGQVYMFKNARPDTDRSLSADGTNDVHTKTTDANDIKQQWYVTKDGDYYVLRNLACGKYLKGNGQSSAWSMTDDYSHDYNKFELYVSNTTYNTLHTKTLGTHAYMHDSNNGDNGGYEIVGWTNADDAAGSHWTITKVNYTAEQIKALLDAVPTTAEVAAYKPSLAAIFKDDACTVLEDSYAAMSVESIKADANYIALPGILQKTVLKIRNDNWAEDNADATKQANNLNWDAEYAKKFRVQMYEPYSIAGDITSWVGINSHANNDNPTGIYVHQAGTIYVMVEGEIAEGATLRLVDAGSNGRILNATTGGNTLQQGLNVINFAQAGGMLYICYNVDTYNPNGADDAAKFPHRLSDYAPLKIHIEGGAINGFYNAQGDFCATNDAEDLWKTFTGASVDKDADWVYMETRANLSVLPILGHRQILLFQLNDTEDSDSKLCKGMKSLLPESVSVPEKPYNRTGSWSDYGMGCDPSTGKINILLEAWDRVMYSELATMGLLSKDDMARMNDFYPRWNADGTVAAEIYDYSNASPIDGKTLEEFCGVDYSDVFNHHGVALGTTSGYMYGGGDHCGYNINTFGGVIESFASNAGSTWGPGHEIGHQHQALLNLNGLTEVTNNLFANVALWYKGMSTSRYNGNEGSLEKVLEAFNADGSDAYTNNIWALTHLYYRLWLYYHLAGNNTQFYPRLFELLRHDPMQKAYLQNGDVSMMHFYKLVCQAAGEDLTEFFRAHGYFSVMEDRFVGDYGNSVYNLSQQMIDEAIAEVKEQGYPENLSILFINDDDETANYLQHDGQTKRVIYGETTPNSDFGSVSDFIAGNVATTPYTATLNSDGTITMSGGEGGVGFIIVNEKGEIISFSNKSTFALGDEAMEAIVSGNATIKSVGSANNVVEAEVDITVMQKDVLGALISKAQLIIDKVDKSYTKIGYFKDAAVAGLASALAYAKEVYAASSGFEAAYDILYAEYRKVLENNDAKIPFNPSLTYIITNYGSPSQTMWVNSSNVVRSEGDVDQTSNDARWKFVETGTAGVYNIRTLNNEYIPAVQQSASMNVTATPATDALYTLEEVKDGVWAIKLSPAAGYRNLHSSWNNVVGWETGADASRWYITAVEADPVIADLTDLEVYINKTETLLGEVLGAVTYTKGEPLQLQTTTQGSANYLWSNAPSTAEGSIANLVDDASNNYFHTDWSSEPPSGSHYLAVYLGEDNDLSSFTFSHTTRSGASSDFPKSVDVYGSMDGTTYKFIGSALNLPQSAGTAWEFDGVMLSSYKYLRFNYHANRGYWHMAEFDITPITGFTATVNDTYSSTVDVDKVTAAMNALFNGKRTAASFSPTTDDVAAKLSALRTAYNDLYTQYEATINARKATLAQLVAETETLINSAGAVTFAKETPIALTTSNFYCNAPYIASNNGDYCADYVTYLTDGDLGTKLHTRWDSNSDDGDYHYLRVDAGEITPIDLFSFTYTTASRGKKDMPLTMVVEGANEIDANNSTKDTFTEIATLTSLPEVLNTNTVYKSSILGTSGTKYRYLRFKVTDITVDESDGNGHPFFTMAEFGLASVTEEEVAVNNVYKSFVTEELLLTTVHTTNSSKSMSTNALVTSVPLLDAQIADQTAAKAALEEAMAKMTVDKTALQSLYNDALALYGEMVDGEGNVNDNYRPSALTNEMLATAKTALDVAKEKLDNSNSQTEVDEAKTALQTAYDALLAVENANVATTIDKSELNTAIANANTLIDAIEAKGDGYYESVAGFGLAELSTALQSAQDVVDRFYLTEAQYNEALDALNNCYTTTNGIVALDCNNENRNNLSTLIGNVNTLLTTIAVEGETTVALPLQATTSDAAFYIWCNAPASDSQGVVGLIDKNSDGTANTETFLGTVWGTEAIPAYTHYIEIDLGVAGTIDQLTMDYTTRNSGLSNQRPNAIKILGSNDKENYTPITEITEGLATGQTEKWTMTNLLELGAHYRYIRFAVGSEMGFFHMSDFNLYTKLSHTLKEYYTTAEGLDLVTLCLALDEAQDAAACYMTTEQYTAVYNKLNGCYTTANAIASNDYSDREALATLKTDASTLVNDVVSIDETETVLALQATDANAPYYIYCNAPGATNNYAGDNLGVAALLDADEGGEPITATFLHTSYVAGSHDDALDHYLRVDMGESNLLSFKFRYTPRIGNTGNAPLVMLIEGSNDCENFEEITTLSDMATTYQSGEITNGKAYRYIRFMVKETHNHSKFDNHEFFAMSHFEMTACKTVTISQEYASPNLSVDVAANAYNEVVDANALDVEHYLPSEVGTAAKSELQAAKDALDAAIALKNIPVKLTTDANNPVLYKIRINRSYADYASLQFDASDSKVAVAAMTFATADAQSWFFMQGTDDDSYDDILIMPYVGGETPNITKRLAAADTDNGAGKVMAVEENHATYTKQNWYITVDAGNTAEGWWNIRPEGKNNYFSNHSGNGNKMGFWNSSSDDGSEFKFILDEAYAIVEEAFASYGREPDYAGVPGYLATDDYNNAYDALANYVENKSGEDAEVFGAFAALKTAKTNATYVPSHDLVDGGVYRIMNLITNTETQYKYHYIANNNAKISFPTEPADDGSDLWVCIKEGDNYKFVSALGTLSLGWKEGAEDAQAYSVADGYVDGAKRMKNGNTAMALTNEKWGELDFNQAGSDGNKQENNWSTDWFFQKVGDASVEFDVNISSRRFSSLYLPYNVTVPAGVSAFTAVAVDGGYVDLYRVADNDDETAAGNIIPARTPVILYIEDDNEVPASSKAFTFEFTAEDASLSQAIQEQISEVIIYGKILQTLVQCTDGYRYYKLGSKSGDTVSKMYWMWEEYSEDGTIADGNAGTDNGGYIRCSANKIYMRVQESNVLQNAFSMRFASETTGAEEVKGEDGNVKTIYDLQGRKLNEITHPGFYMINGKKVYVK